MPKKFQFKYKGNVYNASAEAFHEHGKLKYRVAFEDNLIVLHELANTIGSATGPVFIQDERKANESSLSNELIQEIGFGLEEINFFPGSFWVDYNNEEDGYFVQLIRDGNNYKVVYCYLPDIENIQLPLIIKKQTEKNRIYWQLDGANSKPNWFDEVIKEIEKHEELGFTDEQLDDI
ncbi:hypothetical protein A3860_17920 [Niastella vici]|uniref:Uncharacterized protein n=1 Tax=Niastella vici TaxID=1703345 RepID=A0A1V9G4R4_9BACT|nr:hypothetical protein [Niastella vici]OQP65542.1 hypothetical protein A3860_17920 [Niastella vici]